MTLRKGLRFLLFFGNVAGSDGSLLGGYEQTNRARAATPLAAFERVSEAFPSPYSAEDDVDVYISEA